MFQFPTGWNSTLTMNFRSSIANGFNSQRDGILLIMQGTTEEQKRAFQFPTGWNSTNCTRYSDYEGMVSIPNGMEFYLNPCYTMRAESCFNSQRDGILLSYFGATILSLSVSIPNGMEFYLSTLSCSTAYISFNSQRDGILQNGTATQNSYE